MDGWLDGGQQTYGDSPSLSHRLTLLSPASRAAQVEVVLSPSQSCHHGAVSLLIASLSHPSPLFPSLCGLRTRMSFPPHVYPCVLQRLSAPSNCHPSYAAGCAHFDDGEFDKAHSAFKATLSSAYDALHLPVPSLLEAPKSSDERKEAPALSASQPIHPTVLSTDLCASPVLPSPASPPSPPLDCSPSDSSPLRIHPEGTDDPLTRPPSLSHPAHGRSPIPEPHCTLLARYHNGVACASIHLRLYREAKHHLYQAVDLCPASSLYLFNLGCAHLSAKQWPLAVKALRMALRRDERNVSYHSNLACGLHAMKEWNKALAEFSRVVEMTGDGSSLAYSNLACGCIAKGKWKEATAYLRRAIELEERTQSLTRTQSAEGDRALALLHSQAAFCCLELGSALPAALYHASTATSLLPTLPHAWRHRALVWAAQSAHVLAVADAQQAQSLWMDDALDPAFSHRKERLLDELLSMMQHWRSKAKDEVGQKESITALLTPPPSHPTIPLHEHEAQVKALHTSLAQLQLARTAAQPPSSTTTSSSSSSSSFFTDSTPPTPRTAAKQERVLCVVCMDQPRSQLFEPCKHLLCCEGCGSLVRACPFCKVPIKKRRGPIYM